jgi:citrate lyase subunit beta/citryl-CoA lyase
MANEIRPRRSVLYMPGSNARALEKARTLDADALILDLEDAVAPDNKHAAREQVVAAVKAGGYGPREIAIRVNALSTPWGGEDLAAAVAAMPDAILVPKISSAAEMTDIAKQLKRLNAPEAIRVWIMVETAASAFRLQEIAATARDPETRLSVFILGTNDYAKETRAKIVPGRATLMTYLSLSIAAARAYGIDVIDGVYNDISNLDGLAAECAEARDLGFDGKTLIHPSHIAPCNAAFSPSADEIAAARKVVAAFDDPANKGKGVLQIDGRMYEILHAEIAKRTVQVADAIAERQAAAAREAARSAAKENAQ